MNDLCWAVVIRRCPHQSFSIASLEFHQPPHVSIEFLHRQLDAKTLECLAIIHERREVATLWMDEEGKLIGKAVSALVRVTQEHKRVGTVTDMLVGNLVLTGPVDEEGQTLLLPKHVALELCDVLNEGGAVPVNSTLHMLAASLPVAPSC